MRAESEQGSGEMPTPIEVRDRVRSGILSALDRDVERRGGRTARRLLAAGALGVVGALGMVRIISGHPFGHHPSSHAIAFTAVWSGLLFVAIALTLLEVRTPSFPLARAAAVGIVGLGLAGVCSAFCPDQHFLSWWTGTRVGGFLGMTFGLPESALCLGFVTTAFVGALAAIGVLGVSRTPSVGPSLPAAMLVLLLSPGIALQAFGHPGPVLPAWLAGSIGGSLSGVAAGIGVIRSIHRRHGRADDTV
jgi:hypothetical protein